MIEILHKQPHSNGWALRVMSHLSYPRINTGHTNVTSCTCRIIVMTDLHVMWLKIDYCTYTAGFISRLQIHLDGMNPVHQNYIEQWRQPKHVKRKSSAVLLINKTQGTGKVLFKGTIVHWLLKDRCSKFSEVLACPPWILVGLLCALMFPPLPCCAP